jgi:hypothetical protein
MKTLCEVLLLLGFLCALGLNFREEEPCEPGLGCAIAEAKILEAGR